MAIKAKAKEVKKEAPEKETSETPDAAPLLDMTDAAVRKMIRLAKKRGYVTYEQLNAVLPSEEVTSEKIEDILAMLNEMGINTIESEEAETEEEDKSEDDDDETEGDLVEVTPKPVATTEKKEPSERTDDPVRMYLREMGLGRTAFARGRDCDRQAHRGRPRGDDRRAVRKPAHLPGHYHLARRAERRKSFPARHHRPGSDLRRSRCQEPDGQSGTGRRTGRAGHALCAASTRAVGTDRPDAVQAGPRDAANGDGAEAPAEGEMDDDEFENSMSLAAIEAELKPKVLETFDKIASEYKRLRRLQDQDIALRLKSDTLTPSQERKYKKIKEEIIAAVKSLRLNQNRIDALVDQLYDINQASSSASKAG